MRTGRICRACCPDIGLDVGFDLFEDRAPEHVGVFKRVVEVLHGAKAKHAVYTGPEISCPIDAAALSLPLLPAEPENAERYPPQGALVMVCAQRGRWGDFPPRDLVDIGIFYAGGGQLLFPFGWVEGSIIGACHRDDLNRLAHAGQKLRSMDGADLSLSLPV